MSIQLIVEALDKIEARSIHFPLCKEEYLKIYTELLEMKEDFLMSSFINLESNQIEDIRFRLMENILMYRRYIKEANNIAIDTEMKRLNILYRGGNK